MKYLISILIPTLIERKNEYGIMLHDLYRQVEKHNLKEKVEIISICDDRSISLSEKRNTLQKLCSGKYFMHLDDDDELSCDYCKTIIDHIEELDKEVDVIGYDQLAKVKGERFIVKPHLDANFGLNPSNKKTKIPEFFRYPWQYNLWNERFKTVYRTDSDTNAREDQNWLMKVRLEYPKNMSYIPFIGHTYNFDDPEKSTCQ